jgi:sodium/proline symporter
VLRIISALVILVFFTIYCASGIVAGARLFESTFGMSYETALWAGAAATILYLRGRFPGGELDRHRAGEPDDLRPDPDAGDCDFHRRRLCDSLEVIKQKSIENVDMLKGLNFVAIVADGLGPGLLRSAAYSGALYGG